MWLFCEMQRRKNMTFLTLHSKTYKVGMQLLLSLRRHLKALIIYFMRETSFSASYVHILQKVICLHMMGFVLQSFL